jgi:hypothetical protein
MKEFGSAYNLSKGLREGYDMDEMVAMVIGEAGQCLQIQQVEQRPVFLWRKLDGEEWLGWYAGPPSGLAARKKREDWREVNEQALGEAKIIPILEAV